jgi:hypothetical protein
MDCVTVRYEVLPKQKKELLQWVCLENQTYPWLHFIAPKGSLPTSQHPAPVHYPLHNNSHYSIPFLRFNTTFITIFLHFQHYKLCLTLLQEVYYSHSSNRVTSKCSFKHGNMLNSLRAVSDFVWSAWISVTFEDQIMDYGTFFSAEHT